MLHGSAPPVRFVTPSASRSSVGIGVTSTTPVQPKGSPPGKEDLLRVEDLRTYFYTRRGVVKAVDGVSFSVAPGETLGIGESGSGKTVTSLSLLRLVPQPGGKIVS